MGFLQGLLLILKLLGILLAFAIGLVIFLIGLVLLVPLRYQAKLQKNEELWLKGRISWLFRLISLRISYDKENRLFYELRILGFLFLSADADWKQKHEEKKKKKAKRRAQKQERKHKEKKEALARRKKGKARKAKQGLQAVERKDEPFVKTETTEPLEEQKTVFLEDKKSDEPRRGGLYRIMEKLKGIVRAIADKLKAIGTAVTKLLLKAKGLLAFLTDEANRAAFGAGWTTLVRLLKHIAPTKVKGFLAFGMEDPATTGYVLAVLGIFYGKLGKRLRIQPNFTEKQLEAALTMRGRVRIGTVLWLLLKLWRNKNVKSLIASVKKEKQEA